MRLLADDTQFGDGQGHLRNWGNGTSVCSWHVQHGDMTTGVACGNDPAGKLRPVKLVLEHAGLSGHIPASIAQLTTVSTLSLWHNSLNGTIPPEIGRMAALTSLNLNNNLLSGQLPGTIGNLNLSGLGLSFNRFAGTIPAVLATSRMRTSYFWTITDSLVPFLHLLDACAH